MLVVNIMPDILELELLELITVRRMEYALKKRRPFQNPFDVYTEKQFQARFRFSKARVKRLHDKIVDHLQYVERSRVSSKSENQEKSLISCLFQK